ncbi:IclR family transcriptional regulator, partial [Maribellus luteus]
FHAQRGGELEHTLRTFVMRLSAMLQAPAERPAKAGSRRSRAVR